MEFIYLKSASRVNNKGRSFASVLP